MEWFSHRSETGMADLGTASSEMCIRDSHVDADGDMVIVQNPTLAPAIEKSDYEPKTPEPDASVAVSYTHLDVYKRQPYEVCRSSQRNW